MPESQAERSHDCRCIAVSIRGALYGLLVEDVQEVISLRPVTKVFHATAAIFGVTSLRGDVLPVLDVGVLLGGAAATGMDPAARIVVVREAAGRKRRAGLLIDELGGLREFAAGTLAEVPQTASASVKELVQGVIASPPPCSVLDLTRVFDAPAIQSHAGGEGDA